MDQSHTATDQRRRSILFIVAGIIFIGLVFLLIWFMKERNTSYISDTSKSSSSSSEHQAGTVPSTGSSNQASDKPSSPPVVPSTDEPATPDKTPVAPSTNTAPQPSIQALPSTGIVSDTMTFIALMVVIFSAVRFWQSRQVIIRA